MSGFSDPAPAAVGASTDHPDAFTTADVPMPPPTLDQIPTGAADDTPASPVAAIAPQAHIEEAGTSLLDEFADPDPDPTAPLVAATGPTPPMWSQAESGRWVVGDPGNQERMIATPSPPWGRPDTVLDGAHMGSLVYRACSIRGLSHHVAGVTRQDSYGYQFSKGGHWLAGCVADGVSEAKHSHLAADTACTHGVSVLIEALNVADPPIDTDAWRQLSASLPWQEAADRSSEAIIADATEHARLSFARAGDQDRADALATTPLTPREAGSIQSTTALYFVVGTAPLDDGTLPMAIGVAAGDCAALTLDSDLAWHPISAVKNEHNDIATSTVRPLPRPQAVEHAASTLEPGHALAVISDGIGDCLGTGQGLVGRFLANRWAAPPDLYQFPGHIAFLRKTFVDDRTAFVVWHHTEDAAK